MDLIRRGLGVRNQHLCAGEARREVSRLPRVRVDQTLTLARRQ